MTDYERTCDSGAELKHKRWLESEEEAGRIKDFTHHESFPLFAYNPNRGTTLIGHHCVDFLVTLPDGRKEVHEIKYGRATKTEAWAMRRKIFKANNPHIRYRVFEFGGEKRKWFINLEDE